MIDARTSGRCAIRADAPFGPTQHSGRRAFRAGATAGHPATQPRADRHVQASTRFTQDEYAERRNVQLEPLVSTVKGFRPGLEHSL